MISRFILIMSSCGFCHMAMAEETAMQSPQGGVMSSMFLFTAMFVVFYFLMIRPQNKKQKEHRNLLNNLTTGDEVLMTSGMIGKINRITEGFFIIAISDGVEIAVQKHAIAGALPKGTMKAL